MDQIHRAITWGWRYTVPAVLAFASCATAFGQTESVIYTFAGQPGRDGYFPFFTSLVADSAGNLYGTTSYGGGSPCNTGDPGYAGCGIVYQLVAPVSGTGPWTENVVWRFRGGSDGSGPGQLLMVHGTLWGNTVAGGNGSCSGGCGYLYRLTPPSGLGGAWSKTDVFDFPDAGAVCGISASDATGNFYGAFNNASTPNGYICKLTRPNAPGGSWTSTDLYEFKGVPAHQRFGDGSGPLGVAFDARGNLWGATNYGGYCQLGEGGSCFGTIFELTPPSVPGGAWTESIMYRFTNRDQNPITGLTIDNSGALYGVTYVETYKFSGSTFSVLIDFSDVPPSGYAPSGGVAVDGAGNVYGTCAAGGQYGYGTVYQLTPPSYSETILHSFAAGTDGWNPEATVILGPGGVIYGTTHIGGNNGCNYGFGGTGCGTVFSVTP